MQSIITRRKLQLDGSALSVTRHYQFMNPIVETSYEKIRLNLDVNDHIIQNCKNEKLEISDKQFKLKPVSRKRANKQATTAPEVG